MNGIPDPGGVSGTFAALERTSPIVVVADGVPTTTSMRVANGTHNEHRAVLQLIRDNIADFEEFGGVAFEMEPFDTAGGRQQRTVAILNEEHATLLLTYMRNNEVVKDFKKRLVREFAALRRRVVAPTGAELFALAVVEAQQMLAAKDDEIAELKPKADLADTYLTAQGGARLVRQVAKTLGMKERDLRQFLVDEKLIYRRHAQCGDTYWDHYADFAHYFLPRETVVQHQFGTCSHYTLMVLPRGVELITQRLRKRGVA